MKRRFIAGLLSFGLILGLGCGLLVQPVEAGVISQVCGENSDNSVCQQSNQTMEGLLARTIEYLSFAALAGSLIFIIIGGIRYAVSSGASAEVAKAKKTVLNAVIGLVISLLALAIVNFVRSQVESLGQLWLWLTV